jgi:hypothetical protein
MLTYEIHSILCVDIHYIDSQPFKVAKATKFDFKIKLFIWTILWRVLYEGSVGLEVVRV